MRMIFILLAFFVKIKAVWIDILVIENCNIPVYNGEALDGKSERKRVGDSSYFLYWLELINDYGRID